MAYTYTLTTSTLAANAQPVVRSDGGNIPPDPTNVDFQAYLAWLGACNTPAPYVAPEAPIPQQVTRRQFFQAAAREGIISQTDALALFAAGEMPASLSTAIATLPTVEQFPAQLAILGDQNFNRSAALIAALGAAMGKTDADLDALFTLAATL